MSDGLHPSTSDTDAWIARFDAPASPQQPSRVVSTFGSSLRSSTAWIGSDSPTPLAAKLRVGARRRRLCQAACKSKCNVRPIAVAILTNASIEKRETRPRDCSGSFHSLLLLQLRPPRSRQFDIALAGRLRLVLNRMKHDNHVAHARGVDHSELTGLVPKRRDLKHQQRCCSPTTLRFLSADQEDFSRSGTCPTRCRSCPPAPTPPSSRLRAGSPREAGRRLHGHPAKRLD